MKYLLLSTLFCLSPLSWGNEAPPLKSFHTDKNLCAKCHRKNDTKSLVMLTGDSVHLTKVFELCGQCHGVIKRDWELGTHGKKINSWTKSGEKMTCTKCHDAHNPKFPNMKADPAKNTPKFSIPKGQDHE